jgi:hypothetical protein
MSAKIYEFPTTRRFAAATDYREGSKVAAQFSSQRAANISFGAWYHEEAVRAEFDDHDEPETPKGGSVVPFRPN